MDPDEAFLTLLYTNQAPSSIEERLRIGFSFIANQQKQTFRACASAGYFQEAQPLTCQHYAPFAPLWRKTPSLEWWPDDLKDPTGLWIERAPTQFSTLTADARCPVCREWVQRVANAERTTTEAVAPFSG